VGQCRIGTTATFHAAAGFDGLAKAGLLLQILVRPERIGFVSYN
jgi:hypothetical protein